MAKLIYAVICSLDGFVNDAQGNFDWAAPDEQVHQAVNDLEAPIGTHLYGRRMYEVMQVWETMPEFAEESEVTREYAKLWSKADKHVFSSTLTSVPTVHTHLHREFNPDGVRQLKETVATDVSIGGPTIAASALQAGLVDEVHQFLHPILIGAGTPVFPANFRQHLELLDERHFDSGVVHLHYRVSVQ
ncbi:MAG: dihydrofolate reductase family protein [Actinomycetota bacterium]|nr:dihydrofolate reductase family protein [Actinomycetota bacterium]